MSDEYVAVGMSQKELLFAVLSHWEPVNDMAPMPSAPRPLRPYHVDQLYDMGVRVDPTLAVKFKVKGPAGPVFTNDPNMKHHGVSVEEQALASLRNLDPEKAAVFEGLSDAERAVKLDELQAEAVATLSALMKEAQK